MLLRLWRWLWPRRNVIYVVHGELRHEGPLAFPSEFAKSVTEIYDRLGSIHLSRRETMREITHHKTNGCNESLTIRVLDEPGSGGASHHYAITTPNKPLKAELASPAVNCEIMFQNGPVAEAGVNGVTQEALLAIVIDRLESFQKGHHSCRENACALTKLQEAMHWLQHRTNARVARGVEGTHTV